MQEITFYTLVMCSSFQLTTLPQPPHLENRVATFRGVLAQLHREKHFPAFQVPRLIQSYTQPQ